VTGRAKLAAERPDLIDRLPPSAGGLECVVLVDETLAGTARFRDQPRADGKPFVTHLGAKHGFTRVLLVSGDREKEVRYLAGVVGIAEVHAGQSPEEKVEIARRETATAQTMFVGDGVNDAPALVVCTVGVAFGPNSDVAAEAAGAVILEASLRRVDEFLHIGQRLRSVALQSAVGGIALSLVGMVLAAIGLLPPVAGAITQELIDVAAVLNALRVAFPPRTLTDY
jgi:P-type E1-E2 ATPase